VIASHSGCRALHDHPRNLTDEQLRALAQQGGVVGIVFCPGFLDAEVRADEQRVRSSPAWEAIRGGDETETFLLRWQHLQRVGRALPLERVLDHFCHAAEVAGVEHVGVGSDYDGIDHVPEGLEDATCYPSLEAGLARRGFDPAERRAILGGNLRRVFAAATGAGTRAAEAPIRRLAVAARS
jgi:membrane dipeptidase